MEGSFLLLLRLATALGLDAEHAFVQVDVAHLQLDQLAHAYAVSVHKSQGSEFGRVLIVLPPDDSRLLTRELTGYEEYRRRVRYRLIPYVW
jgi:hypothetical protein